MRNASLMLLTALTLAGCEMPDLFNTVKVDNPVMGPPPPRIASADDPAEGIARIDDAGPAASGGDDRGIVPAKFSDTASIPKDQLDENEVVATVNGYPIFAADITAPYSRILREVREKQGEKAYEQGRKQLIKRDLKGHIENRLLVSAMRRMLKKEQAEQFDQHLDERFQEEVAARMKKLNLTSKHELDMKLQSEAGISLESWRTLFRNQQMAGTYRHTKSAEQNSEIERHELLNYYGEHRDKYSYPAEVNWQQIVVSFGKHGGKQQAYDELKKAIDDLRSSNGANFSVVAQQYSNGPKAKVGGRWGWTKRGSLVDTETEDVLFSLPVGKVSQVLERSGSFRLVKVVERKPAGVVPFPEVQQEIKAEIQQNRREESADALMSDLYEDAIIETILDERPKTEASSTETIVFP